MTPVRYAHTNIVARDWKKLAAFYQEVFDCEPLLPERDYQGEWIEKVTGLHGMKIRGIHLKLPGFEQPAPTLEIFEYHPQTEHTPTQANTPGFAHIAFHVEDVARHRNRVLQAGGSDLGEPHTMHVRGAGTITLIYMRDPEGNIVELQTWKT